MKKPTLILFLALTIMFCGKAFAQAPLMFNYQAVLRDAGGQLLINQQVQIRISILQNSSFGSVVYSETHVPTTNDNGLIAILVGSGTPINGNISDINWGNGTYYLKSEVDPTGGSNYTLTSTQQLLSVPYALFSNGGDYTNLINKPDIPDIVKGMRKNGVEMVGVQCVLVVGVYRVKGVRKNGIEMVGLKGVLFV